MERKTMGAFIAVLRKSSGMTQRELAEKLGVSDKTISHWERDESAPDISVIPIIADIFSVSCDELLRGERRSLSEPNDNSELSQKSEKQIHFLLSKQYTRYLIQCLLCAGNSALGLAVGFLLYDWKAFSCFAVSLAFNIVSILLLVIFSILNKSKLSSFEIVESFAKPYKSKMKKALILSAFCIAVAIAFSLLFEIGGSILLVIIFVGLIALSFIIVFGGKKLKKMTVLTLVTAVSVAVILISSYQMILLIESTHRTNEIVEEMTFENIYAFKEFMETKTDYPDYDYEAPNIDFLSYPSIHIENGYVDIEGNTSPEGKIKITIYDDWNEKGFSLYITWNNLAVADVEVYMDEPTDDSEVRCIVYRYENIQTKQSYEHAVWIDFAVIIAAAVIVYIIIARKILKKSKGNKK